ncbi:unnamed protein product, partial [Adineta ricciae]
NFATDGVAIATKFHHLKVLLQAVDPVYWHFLETCDAVNLYFAYRWLLLECKREFPFHEALRVLEVMWATLPIDRDPPQLSEASILPAISDNSIVDMLCSIPCRPPQRRALSCPQLSVINESYSRKGRHHSSSFACYDVNDHFYTTLPRTCHSTLESDEYQICSSINNTSNSTSTRSREKSFENSFSLSEISEFDSDNLSLCSSTNAMTTTKSSQCPSSTDWVQRLPPNNTIWLEEENSFLLFLCISILLAHRTHLLKQKNLEEQDINIHFDRYRRQNHSDRILPRARNLYAQYIQYARKKRMVDDLSNFSAS